MTNQVLVPSMPPSIRTYSILWRWFLAAAVMPILLCLGIGWSLLLSVSLGMMVDGFDVMVEAISWAFGIGMGCTLAALCQWRVLRRVLPIPRSAWLLTSLVPLPTGFLICLILWSLASAVGSWSMAWGVLGFVTFCLCIGIAQWFIISRYLPTAWIWILPPPIAGLVAGILFAFNVLAGAIIALNLLYAILSSSVLVVLVRPIRHSNGWSLRSSPQHSPLSPQSADILNGLGVVLMLGSSFLIVQKTIYLPVITSIIALGISVLAGGLGVIRRVSGTRWIPLLMASMGMLGMMLATTKCQLFHEAFEPDYLEPAIYLIGSFLVTMGAIGWEYG